MYDDDPMERVEKVLRDKRLRIMGAIEPPEIRTFAEGSRIGNAERSKAILHIEQMADKGYLPEQEFIARIKRAEKAETERQLRELTSDLPPYEDKRSWWNRYWLVPPIAGMALSACLAIIPTAVMVTERVYPEKAYGIGLGLITIIVGALCFFSCILALAVRCNKNL